MSEPSDTVKKLCPQCAAPVDADARFCKYCAFDLSGTVINQIASAETEPTRAKNLLPIILGVVGLLAVGIVGSVILLYALKSNQPIAESVNSDAPAPAEVVTLSKKAQQAEEKILRGEALSASDIEGIPSHELRILRNAHFARYGRKYERPGLGDYFYTRSWYNPNDDYKDSMINATDKENINLIVAKEAVLNNQTAVAVATPTATPELPTSPTPVTGELTREGALALLAGWNREVTYKYLREGGRAVEHLMKEKVITCEKFYPMQGYTDHWRWRNCTPTAKVKDATVNYWAINIPIGYKVANRVTGVSKIDQNTAYADVVFTFQEGANYGLYTKYFAENSDINFGEETQRFVFRLYDDGWRVERNRSGF